MFTSQPQAVEVFERGGWLPASMLGWRHDSDGICSAWVRVEFAGVTEDAWVELSRLRLPQSPARRLALARPPRTTASPAAGSAESASDPVETRLLPLVRDAGTPPVRQVPPIGGRRRAPGTGETAAPPSPLPVVPVQGGPVVPGRHRAPAEHGRHRAADAGLPATVAEGLPVLPGPGLLDGGAPMSDAWSPPPARAELPAAGPVVRGQGARDLGPDRVTRPMPLQGAGSSRRSGADRLGV